MTSTPTTSETATEPGAAGIVVAPIGTEIAAGADPEHAPAGHEEATHTGSTGRRSSASGAPAARCAPAAPPAHTDAPSSWAPRPRTSRLPTAGTDRWSSAASPGSPAATGECLIAGVTKNDAWLHPRAAALNLRRLLALGLTSTDRHWALAC
jgi:hypothetical protein